MKNTSLKKKEGVVERQPKMVLCETVGCGNWTVRIWRMEEKCLPEEKYRLRLFCESPGANQESGYEFRVADVFDLPLLGQLVSQALVHDGWLARGIRDDLSCLSSVLECVVGGEEEVD